jgi:hypothetical protein
MTLKAKYEGGPVSAPCVPLATSERLGTFDRDDDSGSTTTYLQDCRVPAKLLREVVTHSLHTPWVAGSPVPPTDRIKRLVKSGSVAQKTALKK